MCQMARNVEIKAKVHDRKEIIRLAKELTNEEPTLLKQQDIFYKSPQGRLKMRTVEENGVVRLLSASIHLLHGDCFPSQYKGSAGS